MASTRKKPTLRDKFERGKRELRATQVRPGMYSFERKGRTYEIDRDAVAKVGDYVLDGYSINEVRAFVWTSSGEAKNLGDVW